MFHGDILIPHMFGFILGTDQDFVKILSDQQLSPRYLGARSKFAYGILGKMLQIDLHLLD